MNEKIPGPPNIPDEELTPAVRKLFECCTAQKEQLQLQKELIQGLKDEIARLKGEKPKPPIKPSSLGNKSNDQHKDGRGDKKSKGGIHFANPDFGLGLPSLYRLLMAHSRPVAKVCRTKDREL
ncbi:MAG: hypothetical protein SVO01_01605, partial [Thermotogota bacterium]|nr:hypothetical protein [Thermotogota bacterium]